MCASRAAVAAPAAVQGGTKGEAKKLSPLAVALSVAAALLYTLLQLRAATPPPGVVATPRFFFEGNSVLLPAGVTAVYLFGCVAGPRLLASRPALSCKSAMLVYNAYQALFNACCVAVLLRAAAAHRLRPWGNPQPGPWHGRPEFAPVAAVVWLHYNNKARRWMTWRQREPGVAFALAVSRPLSRS